MLLTSTFILIVYNNSAALTSTPNIISSVNIAPKRGMPLDYIIILKFRILLDNNILR